MRWKQWQAFWVDRIRSARMRWQQRIRVTEDLTKLARFRRHEMLPGIMFVALVIGVAWYLRAWSWLSVLSTLLIAYTLPYWYLVLVRSRWPRKLTLEKLFLTVIVLSVGGALLGTYLYQSWCHVHPALVTWNPGTAFFMALAFDLLMLLSPLWLHHQRQSALRLQQLREEQQRAEKALITSELRMLQAQVEPHFLYNTLAQVLYMVRENSTQAEPMLQHLIAYLRFALPQLRDANSNVKRELELTNHYLNIMRYRMGPRLQFNIECADDLQQFTMPPLMLISLVENAIRHGIEPKPGPGKIAIEVCRKFGQLSIAVTDNGLGLNASSSGSGVGLNNIRHRLCGLYGDSAELRVSSHIDGGFYAELLIPVMT